MTIIKFKLIPACSFPFIWCMVFTLNQSNLTIIGLRYLEYFFYNCHLEVYYKVDRLLSDNSILHDNSKLRVSIRENTLFLYVMIDAGAGGQCSWPWVFHLFPFQTKRISRVPLWLLWLVNSENYNSTPCIQVDYFDNKWYH